MIKKLMTVLLDGGHVDILIQGRVLKLREYAGGLRALQALLRESPPPILSLNICLKEWILQHPSSISIISEEEWCCTSLYDVTRNVPTAIQR